jgi:hypothetical protein
MCRVYISMHLVIFVVPRDLTQFFPIVKKTLSTSISQINVYPFRRHVDLDTVFIVKQLIYTIIFGYVY